MTNLRHIHIHGAREHNLKNVSVKIPHGQITVVTGVSGSGKSSLVYDTIYRDAERRFSGAYGSLVRRGMIDIARPDVDDITGLIPAVALASFRALGGARSTVGTMTEVSDSLRVLFSKVALPTGGQGFDKVLSSHFSFNHPLGACSSCQGHGLTDQIDPALIIADPKKSIAERCLVPTTPNGYIMYSQVTLSVLNDVCRAHGFDIDTPWEQLTDAQRHVVLYGSDRVKVLFGKHPLENRLKWKGITAKPREEGFYKGIVPVMETILSRERNDSIMRFVRSTPCPDCRGGRLNPTSLSYHITGKSIADIHALSIEEVSAWIQSRPWGNSREDLLQRLLVELEQKLASLEKLGVGYLALGRESSTLSAGEVQRLKLAAQLTGDLTGVLYVLDEPSVGLHARDSHRLLGVLGELRDQGNTVLVVEHDERVIQGADHVIELGPKSGKDGGQIITTGPWRPRSQPTHAIQNAPRPTRTPDLEVRGARANNLKNIHACFLSGAINVITGVSGAGKSSLVKSLVDRHCESLPGFERFKNVASLDQHPMGRNSRSNPATYTKLMDQLRDFFAALDESRARGLTKSHFSFNAEGGRCDVCEGSGVEELGLHFLGVVEAPCPACEGRRFSDAVLGVTHHGKSIADVLALTVDEAAAHFHEHAGMTRVLRALQQVGLGYITLGQSSNTLSGGEAQRVKIAAELCRPRSGQTLYLLDEPTRGLHRDDVGRLLATLRGLCDAGHTIIVVEHHLDFITTADWVIDIGPEGGQGGGQLVAQGTPREITSHPTSHTARALRELSAATPLTSPTPTTNPVTASTPLEIIGARTGNLKDLRVTIPRHKMTAITGVSGAGKSSLAFDTLYAEGQNRFTRHLGSRARRHLGSHQQVEVDAIHGLSPTMGLDAPSSQRHPRSTLGTVTQIDDFLRLLFSRFSTWHCPDCHVPLTAGVCPRCERKAPPEKTLSSFSFNRPQGACPACRGLGTVERVDPTRVILKPEQPLFQGALGLHKTTRFYGDPEGQHAAVLMSMARHHQIPLESSWNVLSPAHRAFILHGTGDTAYDVVWNFRRGARRGTHAFTSVWKGLCGLILEEYERKRGTDRSAHLEDLITQDPCDVCLGSRLAPWPRQARVFDRAWSDVINTPVDALMKWIETLTSTNHPEHPELFRAAAERLLPELSQRLRLVAEVGLGYLTPARAVPTLSSGEARRLALACHAGAELGGVIYVLDEPTAGLHPTDIPRLMGVMNRLLEHGNTLVVIEHNMEIIARADHIIDLGPRSGAEGGRVVAAGSPAQVAAVSASITGQCLRARESVSRKSPPSLTSSSTPVISVRGIHRHNLTIPDIDIPTKHLVGIAGPSGSGKSTLVFDVLAPSARRGAPCGCRAISGLEHIRSVITCGDDEMTTPQKSVGHALQLWKNFADLSECACSVCHGAGHLLEGLGFLGDIQVPCESCEGRGFSETLLERDLGGLTLKQCWTLPIKSLLPRLDDHAHARETLTTACRLGLGSLTLGQPAKTLSSGELRRLRLCLALTSPPPHSLILLDEPSRGLHESEIAPLADFLEHLRDKGHSLVVIDHRPALLARMDTVPATFFRKTQ